MTTSNIKKVRFISDPKTVLLKDISKEMDKHPVEKFSFGGYENKCTAMLFDMGIDEINEFPNGMYEVVIKSTFMNIFPEGGVSGLVDTGYSSVYTNNPDNITVDIAGYAEIIEEENQGC